MGTDREDRSTVQRVLDVMAVVALGVAVAFLLAVGLLLTIIIVFEAQG